MAEIERTGRCFCGRVRFTARGEPKWVAHCHCKSCRRATSSPFTTYAGYPSAAVTWLGETPGIYHSTPGVTRKFCRNCGAPLSFEGDRWSGETHLFVGSCRGSISPTACRAITRRRKTGRRWREAPRMSHG